MTPIEYLYYLGYSLKKHLLLKSQKRLPHPVISIGNITVGGTGKTPATIAVAEEASRRGYYPIILTRGYKGRAKGPCLVTAGGGSRLSVADTGDEPALMADRLSDCAIIKSADRFSGGMFALSQIDMSGKKPVFILDDGFQRWDLARDADVVLVDGINPFGRRRLIPLGSLRGPLDELKDADVLVITKTRNDKLASELRGINPVAPIHFSEYRTIGLRSPEGAYRDLDYIRGKKVFAFCGIANPASFRKTLESAGCNLIELMSYRDHYAYSRTDIGELVTVAKRFSADIILTTEKDMVKIRELTGLPAILYAFQVNFSVGEAFFDDVFSRIEKTGSSPTDK
jgi:tetraacyldisaccharide 4'-kinase